MKVSIEAYESSKRNHWTTLSDGVSFSREPIEELMGDVKYLKYARKYLSYYNSSCNAEDVIQDVAIAIIQNMETGNGYDPSKQSLEGYIAGMIKGFSMNDRYHVGKLGKNVRLIKEEEVDQFDVLEALHFKNVTNGVAESENDMEYSELELDLPSEVEYLRTLSEDVDVLKIIYSAVMTGQLKNVNVLMEGIKGSELFRAEEFRDAVSTVLKLSEKNISVVERYVS